MTDNKLTNDEYYSDWQHLTGAVEYRKTKETIAIHNDKGQSLTLDLKDGVLTQGGDMPMDEGAKIFFKELQRIAEDNNA